MEKPKHISEHVWAQHLEWMRIMRAGQITNDPVIHAKKTKAPTKEPQTSPIESN